MKKILIVLPLLFFSFSADGQNSDKFTGSLLWKISGNGLEKPSYIFGTHHAVDTAFALNYPGFVQALEGAEQVVGEIDMSDVTASQQAVMSHTALPTGTTYESLLTPDELRSLDESLRSWFGAGLERLGKMNPGVISMMATQKLLAEAMPGLNWTTHVSIDQYVQDRARKEGKKVGALETLEEQIQALFYAEPLEVQARTLLCGLSAAGIEYGKEAAVQLNKVYAEADLYEAYRMTFEDPENPCPMSAEMAIALVDNRNARWVEQLPGIFADRPAFVAVGMLHLCGEKGLLCELDRLGYTIEAIE
jgi:uncharacterized protein YbaP (TraB family)